MKKKSLILGIIIFIICLAFGIVSCINKESNEVMINEISNELISIYIENGAGQYDNSSTFPLKNDGYIFSKAECKDEVEVLWDAEDWSLNVLDNVANISCKLYFDLDNSMASEIILANKTISKRSDFSTTITVNTTGTIYSAEDDDGTSYYFAGAPTDNWVKFGGFYWRIVRINGDGTIRLIYNGTSTITTGTGVQIGTSAFNSSYNNNAYVGYMYTGGSVHGLGTNSTIKGVLDNWYDSNLTSYASYIDTNAGFCGDRTPSTSSSTSNGSGGTGTTTTYYGAYIRLQTNKSPTYKCANSNDLYTTSSSSKGNKALTNPIGLISVDEVGYAGGVHNTSNTSYYLYTNQNYWTISPKYHGSSYSYNFYVSYNGHLTYEIAEGGYVQTEMGIRPVINLRADVKLTGSGTSADPFVVVGAE